MNMGNLIMVVVHHMWNDHFLNIADMPFIKVMYVSMLTGRKGHLIILLNTQFSQLDFNCIAHKMSC